MDRELQPSVVTIRHDLGRQDYQRSCILLEPANYRAIRAVLSDLLEPQNELIFLQKQL